jgi:hypothetical protein
MKRALINETEKNDHDQQVLYLVIGLLVIHRNPHREINSCVSQKQIQTYHVQSDKQDSIIHGKQCI